jgi:hypothetical protein
MGIGKRKPCSDRPGGAAEPGRKSAGDRHGLAGFRAKTLDSTFTPGLIAGLGLDRGDGGFHPDRAEFQPDRSRKMDPLFILTALYLAVALWVGVRTYREHLRAPLRRWPLHLCAALACLLWPLVVIAILATPEPGPKAGLGSRAEGG